MAATTYLLAFADVRSRRAIIGFWLNYFDASLSCVGLDMALNSDIIVLCGEGCASALFSRCLGSGSGRYTT